MDAPGEQMVSQLFAGARMNAKFLKSICGHCGGHIEFPAEGIGLNVPCPHCGAETELTLATPALGQPASRRGAKWAMIGALILVIGLVASFVALGLARRMLANSGERTAPVVAPKHRTNSIPARPTRATVINDFEVSPVAIEKRAGSSLVYAAGSLKNQRAEQRFGVTVEMELFDAAGARLGTAQDYRDVVEPNAEWQFRALLLKPNVASARITAVREK